MRLPHRILVLAVALTAVVAVSAPVAAAPATAPRRIVTEGFQFPSKAEALKHLPELRRKVAENADKPKPQPKKSFETPADLIRRTKETRNKYAVPASSLSSTASIGNEDWITNDQCEAVYNDGYTGDYWYRNKFSSCYSTFFTWPLIDMRTQPPTPIADIHFDFTWITRGYNGQRFLDAEIEFEEWDVDVHNSVSWAEVRQGLFFRFHPGCYVLASGSSCGEQGQEAVQLPYGQNAVETLYFSPTTTTPWSGDTNPQDNKGYYAMDGQMTVGHLTGLITPSSNSVPSPNGTDLGFRCDNAQYGTSLGSGGCVFTDVTSYIQFSCHPDQGITESACLIKDAFEDITRTYPGLVGTYVPGEHLGVHGPLTRNYHQNMPDGTAPEEGETGVSNTSRNAARALCVEGWGTNYTYREDGQTNDCDEYPFLATYQNANAPVGGTARRVAVRPVLSTHNQLAGRKVGSYYSSDRVLDGDAFFVQIVDRGYCDSGGGGGGGGIPVGGTNRAPVLHVEPVTLEGNTTGGYTGPIPGVTATDPDGDAVTLTNNAPATLPLGVTTVGWVARDTFGVRSTASQLVTVVDTRAPSITCPPDAVYNTLRPTLASPTVHDAVDANPTVTNDAPALFPLGMTTVTWRAADHSGNSATCTQRVEIIYAPPLAGGQAHSLAVNADGSVSAWGNNTYGQLGNGGTTGSTTAVPVSGLSGMLAVTAGNLSSYSITTSGTVYAWGDNGNGQLGNGTRTRSSTPVQVTGLSGARQVAAGNYHVLALKADGTVVAWGSNSAGQLGNTTAGLSTTPVAVPGLTKVVQVAAGGLPGWAGHSVALKSDGTVWTWGYGKHGQLGHGVNGSTPTPRQVAGVSGIVQVAANGDNTYALKSDGTVYAWGDGAYGQIGNVNAEQNQNTPLQSNITNVVAIAAGGVFAMAIKTDGTVWTWGDNNTGQLGDGALCGKYCTTPVQATGLTGAGWIAGGYVHSLAEKTANGSVYGWGSNSYGQLGNGTTIVATTPTLVTGVTAKH